MNKINHEAPAASATVAVEGGAVSMRGIVLSEGDLRSALSGELKSVTLPTSGAWAKVAAGDLIFVKEAWSDVHPLGVQDGRYSQEGGAGIPGPPPVKYRTVYRIDGPTLKVWDGGVTEHPYRALKPDAGCFCRGVCRYPTVCSDHHLGSGERMFWYPARECPQWAARLFLRVEAIKDGVAMVIVIHRRDLPADGGEVEKP